MIEAQVEGTIVNRAQAAGWFVRKVQWVGISGAPDRLFARDGRTLWIEFKRPGGRVRGRQQREHAAMRAVGLEVHVIDNVERAEEVLGL